MLKPSTYLIFAVFLITLEIYRLPTPLGFNIAPYHIFFLLALFIESLAFLSGFLKIHINRDTKVILIIFILFAGYSFISFMRNIGTMKPESMSMYFSELVGYALVLSVTLFIGKMSELQRITKAFLASSLFVYMGAFWHIYNFTILGQYVTGTPFWHEYTKSEHVMEYLLSVAWFAGFPRFRLPFSSPASTGVFLSLTGILLLALTLHNIVNKKKRIWLLIALNLLNFFCLLGTFARASWAVFLVGSLFTIWYFRKLNLISLGKNTLTLLVSAGIFFAFVSLTPIGNEFFHKVGLRFSSEAVAESNIGHMESRLLALHYWEESPILGLGIGGFFQKPMGGIHTHSTYFTILVDRGLIGLLLYLGFVFQIFHALKRKVRLSREHNDKTMLAYDIGFLGGLIGLFVGMFLYEMDSEVTWLFFGMMLTCVNLSARKKYGFL
jgi:O-antigen ligase